MGLFRRLTGRLQEMRARVNSRLVVIRNSMLQLKNRRKKIAVMSSDAVVSEQIVVELPPDLSHKWGLTASSSIDSVILPAGPCVSPSSLQTEIPHGFFAKDITRDSLYESENDEDEEEEDSLMDFDWSMSIGSDSVFTDTLSYKDEMWNLLVPEDNNSQASSLTISSKGNDDCLSVYSELGSPSDNDEDDYKERNTGKRAMSDTELHSSRKSGSHFISNKDSRRFSVHQDYLTKSLGGPLLPSARLARPLLPTMIYRNDWYSPPKNFRPTTTILTAACFD